MSELNGITTATIEEAFCICNTCHEKKPRILFEKKGGGVYKNCKACRGYAAGAKRFSNKKNQTIAENLNGSIDLTIAQAERVLTELMGIDVAIDIENGKISLPIDYIASRIKNTGRLLTLLTEDCDK